MDLDPPIYSLLHSNNYLKNQAMNNDSLEDSKDFITEDDKFDLIYKSKTLKNMTKNKKTKKQKSRKNSKLKNNDNNIKVFVCSSCPKKYKTYAEDDLLLCDICLTKEIKNNVKKLYMNYLNSCDYYLKTNNNKNIINNISQTMMKKPITILTKYITLNDAIIQLFNIQKLSTDSKKLKEDKYELFYNILKDVKQKICLECKYEVEKKNSIKIPCGCCFCSKEHLSEYFTNENIIKKSKPFICFCSTQYTFKQLYNLGSLFNNLKLNKEKNQVIKNINHLLKKKCSSCGGDEMKLYEMECKDFDNDNDLNVELFDELKHFLCKKCIKYYRNAYYKCIVCQTLHRFIDIDIDNH